MKRGWEVKELAAVSAINYGYTESASSEPVGPRFLRITDIQNDHVDWESVPYCKIDSADLPKYRLASGDIVFARTGATTGKSFLVDDPPDAVFASYLIRLRLLDKKLLPEFVSLFFQTAGYWQAIKDGSSGSAQGGFNATKLGALTIPVAPFPEQQRIVGILDEAFAGIATAKANTEKNLQNARALFESHLQSVLRNKKWKWKTLGDLCDDVEYGSSAKSKAEGGVPVLRMGNIQDGRLDWENLVYTDDKAEIKKYLLKHNDVLFNRTNSPELVGKTAIYKSEMPAIFAGYLIRIHRKEDLLDSDYLTYFLNSQIAFDYGKTVVISSVNQANINGTKLKSYPISAPSLSEQKAIVAKLNDLSEETQRLGSIFQRKLAALDALKKSLLQQAFKGEL